MARKKAAPKAATVLPGQQSGNTGTTSFAMGTKLQYTLNGLVAGTFTKTAYAAKFGTKLGAAASLLGDAKHHGFLWVGVGGTYSLPNGTPKNWAKTNGVWAKSKN